MKQILAEKIMKWNDVEEKNEVQENADRKIDEKVEEQSIIRFSLM
jgi:hypothetical protein